MSVCLRVMAPVLQNQNTTRPCWASTGFHQKIEAVSSSQTGNSGLQQLGTEQSLTLLIPTRSQQAVSLALACCHTVGFLFLQSGFSFLTQELELAGASCSAVELLKPPESFGCCDLPG